MNVYVASKFENTSAVRSAFQVLRSRGHTVAHDWTLKSADTSSPEAYRATMQACARDDFNGVSTADALLLINHAYGCGMFTELGVALARGIPVVVVEPFRSGLPENIFFYLPGVLHAASVPEAVSMLEGLAP